MTTSGIYQINTPNGFYIGQSEDINHRYACHLNRLRKGTHSNKELQACFNIFGATSFSLTTLTTCNINSLDIQEVAHLDSKLDDPNCLNIRKAGHVSRRHDTRNKMAESKRVPVTLSKGTESHSFNSKSEAAAWLNISASALSKEYVRGYKIQSGCKVQPGFVL